MRKLLALLLLTACAPDNRCQIVTQALGDTVIVDTLQYITVSRHGGYKVDGTLVHFAGHREFSSVFECPVRIE